MKCRILFILICLSCQLVSAQFSFSGMVNTEEYEGDIYLSVIDDYRKWSGVYSEQIIARTKADSSGFFEFRGNQLEDMHQMYRIHVDNCDKGDGLNHFSGHCPDSKQILFLAKNTDTIRLPFGFENEMFCDISSTNEAATALLRIDSLKEHMRYAIGELRSSANIKLNTTKWFKTLQDFGSGLNEPLAQLYVYEFLSDRSSDHFDFYLKDLMENDFYDKLEKGLQESYPDSELAKQYSLELAADRFSIGDNRSSNRWLWVLIALLGISVFINVFTIGKLRVKQAGNKKDLSSNLTRQEQKILDHILDDHTNKDIAEAMYVSVSTVKSHINSIYKKLGVQSREEVKSLFGK